MYDFGVKPIAHRLLDAADPSEEQFPYVLYGCDDCGLVQLTDPIDPEILYKSYNYNFTSWKPEPHRADEIAAISSFGPFASVAEIGCNDGSFLADLKASGIDKAVGIEPNPVSSGMAKERGLTVYNEMATGGLCDDIVAQHGRFDLVVSRQVIEHVLDLDVYFDCIKTLLAEDGLLFLDMPDSACGFEMPDCSVFWEEHVSYFTEPVIMWMLRKHGFDVVWNEYYDFSGGSIAVAARVQKDQGPAPEVSDESRKHLIKGFADRVEAFQSRLKETLAQSRDNGWAIALYGTGARACNLMNGLGLGPYVDFAVDDQKERQGKFMPGCHLEICPPERLRDEARKVLVLLAVNNENDDKVTDRLRNDLGIDVTAVSLLGPKDIWSELDTVAPGQR